MKQIAGYIGGAGVFVLILGGILVGCGIALEGAAALSNGLTAFGIAVAVGCVGLMCYLILAP